MLSSTWDVSSLFYLTPKVRPSPPVLEVRLQAQEKEHFSQQGAAKVNLIPSTVGPIGIPFLGLSCNSCHQRVDFSSLTSREWMHIPPSDFRKIFDSKVRAGDMLGICLHPGWVHQSTKLFILFSYLPYQPSNISAVGPCLAGCLLRKKMSRNLFLDSCCCSKINASLWAIQCNYADYAGFLLESLKLQSSMGNDQIWGGRCCMHGSNQSIGEKGVLNCIWCSWRQAFSCSGVSSFTGEALLSASATTVPSTSLSSPWLQMVLSAPVGRKTKTHKPKTCHVSTSPRAVFLQKKPVALLLPFPTSRRSNQGIRLGFCSCQSFEQKNDHLLNSKKQNTRENDIPERFPPSPLTGLKLPLVSEGVLPPHPAAKNNVKSSCCLSLLISLPAIHACIHARYTHTCIHTLY